MLFYRRYASIEEDSKLPPTLTSFLNLMHSEPMFKLLSRLTGLKLADLAEDDDEEGHPGSSSPKDNEEDSQSNPGCHSEVRQWQHGCYTLMHDADPDLVDFALDAMIFFGCDGECQFTDTQRAQ